MGDGVTFQDGDSINNMFVDMSKLTDNTEASKNMTIWFGGSFAISEDAKTAVQTLKSSKGYASIKVNNVEQNGE